MIGVFGLVNRPHDSVSDGVMGLISTPLTFFEVAVVAVVVFAGAELERLTAGVVGDEHTRNDVGVAVELTGQRLPVRVEQAALHLDVDVDVDVVAACSPAADEVAGVAGGTRRRG